MEESLYGTALQNQEEYHLGKEEEGNNPFDVFVAQGRYYKGIPQ